MPNKNSPIGVFDSGLGGLTAVRELRKILPHENIVYFGDTGRVPYGTRSRDTIIQYSKQDIAFLIEQDVKYIMAACGTVSSILPIEYTNTLSVPYTGVVESAVKAAVNATITNRIGVIGTTATIKSGSYNAAVKKLLPTAHIKAVSCPLFVPLVENGYFGEDNTVALMVANDYLAQIKQYNIDVLILGCTHYPILAPVIRQVMGNNVVLIDPGAQTSKDTMEYLTSTNMLNDDKKIGTTSFFVSDSTENFENLANLFLGSYGEGTVSQISVDSYKIK